MKNMCWTHQWPHPEAVGHGIFRTRDTHGTRHPDVPTTTPKPLPVLGRGLVALMAVAAGLSAAGNYFAQPLLDVIGPTCTSVSRRRG